VVLLIKGIVGLEVDGETRTYKKSLPLLEKTDKA
jgi:hypothetical protein